MSVEFWIGQCPLGSLDRLEEAAASFLCAGADELLSALSTSDPRITAIPHVFAAHALASAGDTRAVQVLHSIVARPNWPELVLVADLLGSTLRHFLNLPSTMDPLKHAVLTLAIDSYASDGLSFFHTAQMSLSGSSRLWDGIDSHFPPTPAEVRAYFYSSARAFADAGDFKQAVLAVAASLASPGDSPSTIQCYRLFVVVELIASARHESLPRILMEANAQNVQILGTSRDAVTSNTTCSVMLGLAQFFGKWNASTSSALRLYATSNEQRFRQFGLWHLVRKCIVAYRIAWLHDIHRVLKRCEWKDLEETGPESLEQLMELGYRVTVTEGETTIVEYLGDEPLDWSDVELVASLAKESDQ